MDRWYTWVENQMYGPYQPEQLSEFIKPDTLLCREGAQEWKTAGEYPELAFFLSGEAMETSPNIGWMVRMEGTDVILGPYSKNKIAEMIQKGEIKGNDLVKHTDWEEWETVSATKLVAHKRLVEKPDRPPSPEGFHKVVHESSDADLLKEYNENYKLYARRERKLLKEELLKRGLIKKTLGLF